jgi:head-tail adaptor
MKAGAMRHWMRLEKPIVTEDAFRGVVKTWEPVTEVDASIDSLTGREALAADREVAGITWRITLREIPGVMVEPNWRGIEIAGDPPADVRIFDFAYFLESHQRNVLTVAATCGQSQP